MVGTAHIDHAECAGGWSGRSELAEERIAEDAAQEFVNGNVNQDATPFYNSASYLETGNHIRYNSGNETPPSCCP